MSDCLASMFTRDGAVRIPHINAEAVSREDILAGIERLQALWDYFVQTTSPRPTGVRSYCWSGDQAQLTGPGDGLGAVGRTELTQHMADVLLDCVQADHELAGDGPIRPARRQHR